MGTGKPMFWKLRRSLFHFTRNFSHFFLFIFLSTVFHLWIKGYTSALKRRERGGGRKSRFDARVGPNVWHILGSRETVFIPLASAVPPGPCTMHSSPTLLGRTLELWKQLPCRMESAIICRSYHFYLNLIKTQGSLSSHYSAILASLF